MLDKKILQKLWYQMVLLREAELKIEKHYHEDQMKTPVHLSLGQEAVSAGVCAQLQTQDRVFSNHRSHGHYLAKGGDLKAMFAELFCKETGCAKGRGGSMHLIDISVGHYGSSSIVGGSIPHAVGAAMAFKMQKKDLVAVSFFGDAASEEGVLQESMNWAKLHSLPVVFVCENNGYSVCSTLKVRQPKMNVANRAKGFDIPALTLDGMNVLEVYEKAEEAIAHARSGKGPFFLECMVQRWRGHAGAGDPLAAQYRNPEDLEEKNRRDPIEEYEAYLMKEKIFTKKDFVRWVAPIQKDVQAAFQYGEEGPLPKVEDLEKYLFCD